MKIFMLATILSNSSPNLMLIQSYQSVPEMDYQMLLTLPTDDKRILLDCQSFINAIYYQSSIDGVWENDWSLMINGGQCEELSQYAKESIDAKIPFCMKVDLHERTMEMSADTSECSERLNNYNP